MTQDYAAGDRSPERLLRDASRLIDQALIKLNMAKGTCEHCGRDWYENLTHARIYQGLTDLPDRLNRLANKLEGKDE